MNQSELDKDFPEAEDSESDKNATSKEPQFDARALLGLPDRGEDKAVEPERLQPLSQEKNRELPFYQRGGAKALAVVAGLSLIATALMALVGGNNQQTATAPEPNQSAPPVDFKSEESQVGELKGELARNKQREQELAEAAKAKPQPSPSLSPSVSSSPAPSVVVAAPPKQAAKPTSDRAFLANMASVRTRENMLGSENALLKQRISKLEGQVASLAMQKADLTKVERKNPAVASAPKIVKAQSAPVPTPTPAALAKQPESPYRAIEPQQVALARVDAPAPPLQPAPTQPATMQTAHPGQSIPATMQTAMQVSSKAEKGESGGAGDVSQGVVIRTSAPIVGAAGEIILAANSTLVLELSPADNGMVRLRGARAIIGNQNVSIPSSAIWVQAEQGQPLMAKQTQLGTDEVAGNDLTNFVIGAAAKVGEGLTKPDSQTTIANVGSIAQNTTNKSNILGDVLAGGGTTLINTTATRNSQRSAQILSKSSIWQIPAGTKISIIVTESFAI